MTALIAIIMSSVAQIVGSFKKKSPEKETSEPKDNVTPIKHPEPPKVVDFPIEFKTDRVAVEFGQLEAKNRKLHALLVDLNELVNARFEKALVITHIFRTIEEQAEIYKDSAKYKRKPFTSPHNWWHGCDLRSRTFTPEEIKWIENYLNNKYNAKNYYKKTAFNHNIGLGDHFHLQYIED